MANPFRPRSYRTCEHEDNRARRLSRFICQSVVTPYALLDRDLRFVVANTAYAKVTGRSVAEMIGLQLFDAFPEHPDLVDGEGRFSDTTRSTATCSPNDSGMSRTSPSSTPTARSR